MKKIIFLFLLCAQIDCFAGAADSAVGVAAAIGIGAGMSSTVANGIAPNESAYWADPRLKSTSKLFEQCGLVIETKIYSTLPYSTMFMGIKNRNGVDAYIFNQQATVTYNSEITRYFDLDLHKSMVIPSGITYGSYLKFHQKSDFKNAKDMQLKIPVIISEKKCDISINYIKNPEYSLDESFVDSEVFTMGLFLGPSFLQGSLSDLTDKSSALEFRVDINTIGGNNNGMFLDFGYTSAAASSNYINAHLLDKKYWSIGGIGVGYLYRNILSDNKNIYVKIGAEFGGMSIGTSGDSYKVNSSFIGANLGLRYNVMFSNVERGLWSGKYYYNIGLNSRYIPSVEFDGQKSSGFVHSLILGISVGM